MEFKRIEQELKYWNNQIEDELKIGGICQNDLLRLNGSKKSVEKWINKFESKYPVSLQKII